MLGRLNDSIKTLRHLIARDRDLQGTKTDIDTMEFSTKKFFLNSAYSDITHDLIAWNRPMSRPGASAPIMFYCVSLWSIQYINYLITVIKEMYSLEEQGLSNLFSSLEFN